MFLMVGGYFEEFQHKAFELYYSFVVVFIIPFHHT